MKIADFTTNFLIFAGALWVIYRVLISFESGLINGMVNIIVLGASTWVITYYANLKK